MLAILSTTPAVHSSAELYEPAAAATAPYPTAGGVSRRATGGGGATRRRRGPRAVVPPAQPGPSVVLLYHIEKTGGSAVMKWLKRQTHAPSRLAAVYSYSQTSCFFALHADLFPGMEPRWRDKLCGGAAPLDWRSSKVAVEFHSYSKGFFLRSVLPALGALKRRYAEANGTVVAVTSIREPASHLLSKYRMWPPRTADRTHAVPLPAWLASGEAHSLQSRALLSERPALPGCEGLTEARAAAGEETRPRHVHRMSATRPPRVRDTSMTCPAGTRAAGPVRPRRRHPLLAPSARCDRGAARPADLARTLLGPFSDPSRTLPVGAARPPARPCADWRRAGGVPPPAALGRRDRPRGVGVDGVAAQCDGARGLRRHRGYPRDCPRPFETARDVGDASWATRRGATKASTATLSAGTGITTERPKSPPIPGPPPAPSPSSLICQLAFPPLQRWPYPWRGEPRARLLPSAGSPRRSKQRNPSKHSVNLRRQQLNGGSGRVSRGQRRILR